jgi:subtilisin family serine protease
VRRPTAAVAASAALLLAVAGTAVIGTTSAQADVRVTGRAVVGFEPDARGARAIEVLSRLGVAPGRALDAVGARVVELAPGMSQQLARTPGVAYVEADQSIEAAGFPVNDPVYPGTGPVQGGQWGIWRVGTPTVWTSMGYGAGVVIAVVDTGVAAAHPDLQGQVLVGRNVLDGSTNTTDNEGHGTSIAGLIAARTNNALGIAGFCGGCRILPVKVTDSVSAYNSDLAAGVTYAVDQGARVINLSFAGSSASTTLANAIAYARSRGAVVVAAAGNSGCDCLTYPAGYSGVIAVGATSNLSGDPLQGYSNYGPWVDVAAPAGMATTTLTDPVTGALYGYGGVGGTSLAAPVVAGIAALLLSARPDATGAAVEQALVAGAATISGTKQVASGRIDAVDAYAAITGAPLPTASPTPTASATPTASPTASATGSPTPTVTPTATTSPTATSAAPTPSASSEPPTATPTSSSPTPTPTTASPTPTTTSTTTTQSASLTRKTTTRSYTFTGPGSMDLALSFGCPTLTMTARDSAGTTLWTSTGPSALTGRLTMPSGSTTVSIGTSSKCSFTLTATVTR